ncbi:hypothetical protein ACHAQJ_009161 [Trichoderma viride]
MDVNQKAYIKQKVMRRLTSSAHIRSAFPASNVFIDKALAEISLLPLSRPKPTGESTFIPRQTLYSCFLQLPPELQFKILSHLSYGEIQRLRQTNRLFRRGLTQNVIQGLFPRLADDMLCTCYICLTQKRPHQVIRGEYSHPRFPLASKCFDCVARRSGFMVGKRYWLVNAEQVLVCRWCGYPTRVVTGWHQPEFHFVCHQKFKGTLATHFGIGAMQWIVVIVGSALCWHYFKKERMVVVPVGINFVMSFWACLLGVLRGPRMRTYHWSLLVELIILALWIPPMYAMIDKAIVKRESSSLHVSEPITVITLALVVLNMLCRLLSCLGHVILVCEWKMWRRSKPGTTQLQRTVAKAMMVLIVWADPQSLQQDYPPTWWFKHRGA